MTKRQIAQKIYLSGMKPQYTVVTSYFDGCLSIPVPTTRVGNAIVRALREEAELRPDLFGEDPEALRAWR